MTSGPDSLRAWVEAQSLPMLTAGYTQPDILAAIEPELPQRLIAHAARPGLRDAIRDCATRNGFRIASKGVNEPGPNRQIEMFTLEEIRDYAAKRRRQGDDIMGSLARDLERWCAAHPNEGQTPGSILAGVA